MNSSSNHREKILLVLLPFWEPQIPPLGITSLKAFLGPYGFRVRCVDANVVDTFIQHHIRYFSCLQEWIPAEQQGNFPNIGQDVFRNQAMAHIHHDRQADGPYRELVQDIVYKNFYTEITDTQVQRLSDILDAYFADLEAYLLALLAEEKPDVLGLSVFRGNLASAMFAFRLARRYYPGIKNVMGGAVFAGELAAGSENLDYFLEVTPYIDVLLAGEGENLFLKYLQGELPADRRLFTLEDIGKQTVDIKRAAIPDFSDLALEFYPNLALYASRSCPFECSFCTETVYWGNYRKKGAPQVVQEMKSLHREHRSQLFLLCDSLLNPIVSDLSRELLGEDVSLYWDGYMRADCQAAELDNTYLWRRGGLYRTRLGIESGSPQVLELMGKKTNLAEIKAALANLAEAGIKTTTYWVLGHPGETEEDFLQTLDLVSELRDSIYEAWCSPFNYYPAGQVASDRWRQHSRLLYPPGARDMLVVQTWTLDVEPLRPEALARMNRFMALCKALGIPNPYSILEFNQADERWKRLHRNAVPALVEFSQPEKPLDENKRVKRLVLAEKKLNNTVYFNF